MKIALINAFYAPNVLGGAEISVQNLAEALVRMGLEVEVISSSLDGRSRKEQVNGVTAHYVEAVQAGKSVADPDRKLSDRVLWHLSAEFNPRPTRVVLDRLNEIEPDIVHTNCITTFSTRLFPACRKAGLPVVHTLRDYYLLCPMTTMHKGGKNCPSRCTSCSVFTWNRRKHSECVSSVVGVSRWTLNRHLEFGLFDHAVEQSVIYNSYERPPGVEVATSPPADQKLRIGYIGRLHPIKGLESLLDVLVDLPSDTWTFDVAGSGRTEYENELRRKYEREHIRFLGWQDTASFLENLDVLVVPSTWNEPMARAILEAYAHGIPVLVSAVGGMPELVEEGRTGWIFEAGNTESIRSALNHFLSTPRKAHDLRADCLRMSQKFAHEETARRYVEVYEKTLSRR